MKFKSFINKLIKKPESKQEQTFQVKIVAIIACVLIVAFLAITLLPKFSMPKKWEGESAESVILPVSKEEPTIAPPEEYVDKYGTKYLKTDLPALGMSTFLPKDWTTDSTSTDGIVYLNGNITVNNKECYLEVSLIPANISNLNSKSLVDAFKPIIRENFRYHHTGSVFKVLDYTVNSSTDVYDKSKQVWVDKSEPDNYTYSASKPNDLSITKEEDKYIGVYQNLNLQMIGDSLGGSYNSANPYSVFYYTYADNKNALAVSCLGALNYSLQTEEIAKTIAYNITPSTTSMNNYQIMPLDINDEIGNLKYYYGSQFADRIFSSGKILMRLSDNFKRDEYGLEIMIYKTTYNSETTNYMTLENSDVINNVFNSYHQFKLDLDLTKEENKVVASGTDSKTISVCKQNCKQYDYYLDLKYDNKNITNQLNIEMPVKNTITFIKDPLSNNTLYAINIRYNDSNEELAMKYYDTFLSKLEF